MRRYFGTAFRRQSVNVTMPDEEASDELVRCERHGLVFLAPLGTVILPLEAHGVAVEREQSAVGDGDAVGVAREVGELPRRSRKRQLRCVCPPP